jgi:hypothetical protein
VKAIASEFSVHQGGVLPRMAWHDFDGTMEIAAEDGALRILAIAMCQLGDEGLGPDGATSLPDNELRSSAQASAAESGAVGADLAAVVAAWPTLAESTRRAILAIIGESTNSMRPLSPLP